ncbi:MAG TPA: glycosyltransferase family 4 protein [Pyrinomonadaceae bacterium]|nr:glycosyltransferase family 4 protein [Pyrinomonadaceae bacterium]
MFAKKIIIVTPWFERFAGGAELLAKGMAREFDKRGIPTMVFTTCSLSPYDSWWKDHYRPGVYDVAGIETRRFATVKSRARYDAVIGKLRRGTNLTARDEQDFFDYGINSSDLVDELAGFTDGDYEIIALPYFHGLTNSVINRYPGKISLIPCFHDEPQFYWGTTEALLRHAKLIFFNSAEEKQMTIRQYGQKVGRRIVEGVVTGVGVELLISDDQQGAISPRLPDSYFVYAGRKEVGKNVRLLCQWFTSYAEKFRRDTKLIFIGGGDKSLIPSTDHFIDLGFVSEATKQHVIRQSKGVINLSENESFSIVIMEGWLLGVPAIVSAGCAVTTNHVRRCNGGLYVANGDEFGLALEYLEEQDAVRKILAANGQQYVSREFSFDAVLARYLREFRQHQKSEQLCSTAS